MVNSSQQLQLQRQTEKYSLIVVDKNSEQTSQPFLSSKEFLLESQLLLLIKLNQSCFTRLKEQYLMLFEIWGICSFGAFSF